MMFYIRTETKLTCPKCSTELDSRPFEGFCSMLGPRAVICPKCHQACRTDRLEWADMNLALMAWYVGVSLLYVAALAMYGATSVWCVLYFWFEAFGQKMPAALGTAFPGAIFWGGLGIFVQIWRVRRSKARKGEPIPLPWWNPDINLQSKMLSALFLLPLTAWAIHFPVSWLFGR